MNRLRTARIVFAVLAALLFTQPFTALAAMSVTTNKASYLRGETVAIRISGGPANTQLGVQVVNPAGGTVFVAQVGTDSGGAASTSYKIASDAPLGTYTVYVSGGGQSAQTTFQVTTPPPPPPPPPAKKPSSISLQATPPVAVVGEAVTVTGDLSPDLAGQTVSLTYRYPGGSIAKTVTTGPGGGFIDQVTPGALGMWAVDAGWAGTDEYEAATARASFYVKNGSSITIELSASEILLGEEVEMSGALQPPLAGAAVTIYVSRDGTSYTALATTATGSDGSYRYSYAPTALGAFYFKAGWPGNDQYLGAESPPAALQVLTARPSTLVISVEPGVIALGEEASVAGGIQPGVATTVMIEYSLESGPWTELARANTDPTGAFAYRWRPGQTGSYKLRASWPGTRMVAGSVGTSALTVSEPLYRVEVRIVDSEDRPVPYPEVTVSGSATTTIVADRSGAAVFQLRAKSYTVTAMWHGVKILETSIDVASSTKLTLRAEVYPLTVKAADEAGNPLANQTVIVKLPDGTALYAQTGPDGSAAIPQVPRGTFEVQVLSAYKAVQVTGPASQTLTTPRALPPEMPVLLYVAIAGPTAIAAALAVALWRTRRRAAQR